MKQLTAILGAVVLAVSHGAAMAQNTNQPVAMMPAPSYEYVQQAASMQYDGQTMTLQGVPSTIFFSDHPYRLSGQVDTARFADLWTAPNSAFAIDPPNAAVSVLSDRENPPAVVELTSAEATEGGISYGVRVLSGQLPESAQDIALFVDAYHPVPGPYCYHAPQAPECHYHPYHPYYPPPYPYHPGAAFAAGAVAGAAAASAAQPKVYYYPVPTGPLPAQCHLNSNHTRMVCSVPIQQ